MDQIALLALLYWILKGRKKGATPSVPGPSKPTGRG
jgi:hypothetical protein